MKYNSQNSKKYVLYRPEIAVDKRNGKVFINRKDKSNIIIVNESRLNARFILFYKIYKNFTSFEL